MTEKERFEEWAKEKGFDLLPNRIRPDYFYSTTAAAWEAWQAALASQWVNDDTSDRPSEDK